MTVRATAAPGPKPSGPRTRAKQSAAALPTRCPSTSERARPRGRCFRCAEEDDGERAERRAEHCDGARQMRERATRENRQG